MTAAGERATGSDRPDIGYRSDPLSDVRDRVSQLEGQAMHFATREDIARIAGQAEKFATKEDVANAKLYMYITWTATGLSILSLLAAIGIVLSRVWPA